MAAALAVLGLVLGGGFEWPGAVDADARDLAGGDEAQRLRAVERLAMREVARTRLLLIPALRDRDAGVRLTAARVLARAGVPEAIEAATQWITARAPRDRPLGLQVLRDAATLPPAARRATERALGDADAAIRVQALDVLAHHEIGPSFGAVVTAVDDDNREVRLSAVRRLGDARDPRASVPLLARLSDTDRQVRSEALRALGAVGDPRVAPALLRQLSEATDDVRVVAIDALARLKVASAVPALVALARRRPSDELARHAQLALGELATPEAVGALVAVARDPPVTDEVKEGLRRAGAPAVEPLIRELGAGTPTSAALAAWALGEIGDRRATSALTAAIERRGGAPAAALGALATLGDPEAVPALVRAAGAASPDVRRLAFEALVAIGDDRATVVLARGLGDGDAGVRARAIKLAVALGAEAVALPVARRLDDPEGEVRREAAAALARIAVPAPEVSASIRGALTHPPPGGRDDLEVEALGDALERAARPEDGPALAQALAGAGGAARAALARGLAAAYAGAAHRPLDDAATVDRLIALVDEGGAVALAAADALAVARLPPGREAPLVRAFGDAEAEVEARLCPALAASEAGAVRLRTLLADGDLPDQVRAAAAWAAASVPDAREALRRASADPAPAVAANARAALAAAARPPLAPAGWVGVRLVAADGSPWPGRWVAVAAGDRTEVWAMTDASGRVRVAGLPPGPYQLHVMDPVLRPAEPPGAAAAAP